MLFYVFLSIASAILLLLCMYFKTIQISEYKYYVLLPFVVVFVFANLIIFVLIKNQDILIHKLGDRYYGRASHISS